MLKNKIGHFNKNDTLMVIGANHRSSTMLLRDQLYIPSADLPNFYKRLKEIGFKQSIILSTNDLTEFILIAPNHLTNELSVEVIKLLAAHTKESRNKIRNQTYFLFNQEAIRHVFATAAALDNLIIGDSKIKNSLNFAYEMAKNNYAIGDNLKNLIKSSKESAKRILRETEIGLRPISIPTAAVQVARDLHGDLASSSCLLIGAGEMSELLASSMRSAGVGKLIASHPSLARAEIVSQSLNCHIGENSNLTQLLVQSDIIITSMNSRKFTLNSELLKPVIKIRKRKPIFIIDTGVPGDTDPAIELLEDIFLYSLDDLERVTKAGRKSRTEEAEMAWGIIDEEINKLDIKSPQAHIKPTSEKKTIERTSSKETDASSHAAKLISVTGLKKMPDKKNGR